MTKSAIGRLAYALATHAHNLIHFSVIRVFHRRPSICCIALSDEVRNRTLGSCKSNPRALSDPLYCYQIFPSGSFYLLELVHQTWASQPR